MFESPAGAVAVLRHVRTLGEALGAFDGAGASGGELVELLAGLERLKCQVEGAQVAATAAFDVQQRAEQAAAGVPRARQGQGVGLQVALARRESHHRGAQHLGLARALTAELPRTLKALRGGRISEWRATIVARETACLSCEDRAAVDAELASSAESLESLDERELVARVKRLAYELDPESVVARRRKAESERCVSLRPAPDTMAYLTALLPVAQGVGAFAALSKAADTMRAEGDARSRGQVMADLMVTRVLGQQDGRHPQVPVTVNVVVSDQVLLAATDGAAEVDGYGPVPGSLARELATAPEEAQVAVRRLYARPGRGSLVGMDSVARCFPSALATLIRLRDRTCRTPWCDAPVRHTDHIEPYADGGPTSAGNGQGLCQACNHAKQAPGWRQLTEPAQVAAEALRHSVTTTTPTGATYWSTAPPCPQPARLAEHRSDRRTVIRPAWPRDGMWTRLEIDVERLLHAS